jgi:PAS domain S-box-containing protein
MNDSDFSREEAEEALRHLATAAAPADPELLRLLRIADWRATKYSETLVEADDQQAVEDQLRRAEARYRALVECIPAVTFFASLDSDINEIYVSPHIEKLLGFTQDQWLGDPFLWYRQLHPDDRDRWHDQFALTCASGVSFRAEYRFFARDGRIVWVHGEASVVRDDLGQPLFIQGVAFDITSIKQAAEQLRQLNELLEQRVAERTTALSQANAKLEAEIAERKRAETEIQRVNAMLREKNAQIQEFVYAVSHDLKSPLVTCQGFLGVLKEDINDGHFKGLHDTIGRLQSATDRMSLLINDLLQLSRVGSIASKPQSVDVGQLLHEMRADLASQLSTAGAVLELQDDIAHVIADRRQLRQAFENLLTNAIKYGRRGPGAKITIGSKTTDDSVSFFVRDNGPGIAPQYHEHIFGMFQRLESDREGTGVGLAIVARIMEVHHGRAWIQSELGQGATFWLSFPHTR